LLLLGLIFQNLLSQPLSAQSGHYVIEQRFVQRIVWFEDEYVLKYEVVIEKDEGEGYLVFMREFTELPELQISLLPGNYRYQVIPFDFLDQPGEASEWVALNVLPAPINIVESTDDNFLLFSYNDSLFKIYMNAVWLPIYPLYGGMQQIYGNEFYASGAALRFGILFTKLMFFNPGLELSTSWYALKNVHSDYKINMNAGVIGFNILAQKWLPNRTMAVTLRIGSGVGFQVSELSSEQDLYPMGGLVPQINFEPSFFWLAMKQLYLEAGLGFTFFITSSNSSGCLRPWLGVGWIF
jgi:hypothetical protein